MCDTRLGGEGAGSGCQGDWKKIQAVARVISHTPFQATSLSHYYSIIAPQVGSCVVELEVYILGRHVSHVSSSC